jgi:Rab-like protein 2
VTYKNLSTWYTELRQFRPTIPTLLGANKIDENMEVTTKSFAFASKNDLPLYYVSAADGTNVVRMFRDAIDAAVKYKDNPTDIDDQILEELDNFHFDPKDSKEDQENDDK